MPQNNRIRQWSFPVLAGSIVLAAILMVLFFRKYPDPETPQQMPPPQSTPEQGMRTVTLFFASPEGGGLVKEPRTIEPCSGLVECSGDVLDELINGPIGELASSLPETTTYHSITMVEGILTIDFGRNLPDGMVSGSEAEMAAVYSVVNTMALNFPEVQCVRFLVDGQPMETLKGHIDLREPLPPDFTQEKGAQPSEAPVTPQRRKP